MERRGFLGLLTKVTTGGAMVPFVGQAAKLQFDGNGKMSIADPPPLVTATAIPTDTEFLMIPCRNIRGFNSVFHHKVVSMTNLDSIGYKESAVVSEQIAFDIRCQFNNYNEARAVYEQISHYWDRR